MIFLFASMALGLAACAGIALYHENQADLRDRLAANTQAPRF